MIRATTRTLLKLLWIFAITLCVSHAQQQRAPVCFNNTLELRAAVDAYLLDPSPYSATALKVRVSLSLHSNTHQELNVVFFCHTYILTIVMCFLHLY